MQTTLQLVADLARVAVALPVFAYASYRDVLERRVEHKTWIPLVVVGVAALAVDLYTVYTTGAGFRRVAIVGGLSLGIGLVFGYGFYYIGAFGGADRYAVLVLALLFPLYPSFPLPFGSGVLGVGKLPVVVPRAPVFVLSVLGNTVIVGLFYPLKLLLDNLSARNLGTRNPLLVLLGKRVRVDSLQNEYGRILEHPGDGNASLSRSGLFSRPDGITDIDFVRDYLEWSEAETLKELDTEDLRLEEFVDETEWQTDDVESDEEELRSLIELDEVWISPGIPFIVPMFLGLLIALTYGDVVYVVLSTFFSF